ncbi:MAG: SapC family protein [Oceanicaulis sp.]
MADAPENQASVQGSLPLYKKPEPLNATAHKGKGLKFNDRPFDFLKDTHFVPVTLGEFGMAGARFPIIFLGDSRTPVAAMGLQAGLNVFVDDKGQFAQDTYLPAYVRRYPFVAATHSEQNDRFTICVDTGSHLFSDKPDEPFFTDDGQPTEFLNRAIEYVRRFESDVQITMNFVEKMKELDLFDQQQATFQPRDSQGNPTGDPQTVATYWGLSGEKLMKLDKDKLAELRDNTFLGAIYAHMLSMTQWDVLIQRTLRAQGQQAAKGGQQPKPGSVPPPPAPEA